MPCIVDLLQTACALCLLYLCCFAFASQVSVTPTPTTAMDTAPAPVRRVAASVRRPGWGTAASAHAQSATLTLATVTAPATSQTAGAYVCGFFLCWQSGAACVCQSRRLCSCHDNNSIAAPKSDLALTQSTFLTEGPACFFVSAAAVCATWDGGQSQAMRVQGTATG